MTDDGGGRDPWKIRSRCAGGPIVYDGVHADLCPALRDAVLARVTAIGSSHTAPRGRPSPSQRGLAYSFPSLNEGGWKSGEDLFAWPDPAVQDLRSALACEYLGAATRPIGWAMVNRLGSRHPGHHHGASVLSGVYYVDPGEGSSAPTIFVATDGQEIQVEPVAGRLALFPGDLWHRVPTYAGHAPRITIAFDVRR
jgi:hypothetical protein